jgi:y4mF family transcriptional regulator
MQISSASDFGELVRNRRSELAITQEALADVIGVNRRVIGELERGKRSVRLQIVLDVARALGMDLHLKPRGR